MPFCAGVKREEGSSFLSLAPRRRYCTKPPNFAAFVQLDQASPVQELRHMTNSRDADANTECGGSGGLTSSAEHDVNALLSAGVLGASDLTALASLNAEEILRRRMALYQYGSVLFNPPTGACVCWKGHTLRRKPVTAYRMSEGIVCDFCGWTAWKSKTEEEEQQEVKKEGGGSPGLVDAFLHCALCEIDVCLHCYDEVSRDHRYHLPCLRCKECGLQVSYADAEAHLNSAACKVRVRERVGDAPPGLSAAVERQATSSSSSCSSPVRKRSKGEK